MHDRVVTGDRPIASNSLRSSLLYRDAVAVAQLDGARPLQVHLDDALDPFGTG